jgi:hypothetical protein
VGATPASGVAASVTTPVAGAAVGATPASGVAASVSTPEAGATAGVSTPVVGVTAGVGTPVAGVSAGVTPASGVSVGASAPAVGVSGGVSTSAPPANAPAGAGAGAAPAAGSTPGSASSSSSQTVASRQAQSPFGSALGWAGPLAPALQGVLPIICPQLTFVHNAGCQLPLNPIIKSILAATGGLPIWAVLPGLVLLVAGLAARRRRIQRAHGELAAP